MSTKDSWKNMGRSIGHAFKDFGKAVGTTAKVAVGEEERTDEDGNPTLKGAWSKAGHGFGDAGKSIGKAAADTANAVFSDKGEESKNGESKIDKDGAIDVDCTEKDSN